MQAILESHTLKYTSVPVQWTSSYISGKLPETFQTRKKTSFIYIWTLCLFILRHSKHECQWLPIPSLLASPFPSASLPVLLQSFFVTPLGTGDCLGPGACKSPSPEQSRAGHRDSLCSPWRAPGLGRIWAPPQLLLPARAEGKINSWKIPGNL